MNTTSLYDLNNINPEFFCRVRKANNKSGNKAIEL